jgi:hypothetical protein
MTISGMSFMGAFYMTAITLSTVGYQEVTPLTPGWQLRTTGARRAIRLTPPEAEQRVTPGCAPS